MPIFNVSSHVDTIQSDTDDLTMADTLQIGGKNISHEIVHSGDLDTEFGVTENIKEHRDGFSKDRSVLWKIDSRLMPLL